MSIPLDGPQSTFDEIPNLRNTLGTLTGSLIEVGQDGSAQFIHLSAHEYFTVEGEYRVCGNRDLAAVCVSYLFYTVAAEPLSGCSQVTPDACLAKKKYPFLDYSAAFWSDHLSKSLKEIEISQSDPSHTAGWGLLGKLVTAFIYDKNRIMMLIEASWLFDSPKVQDPAENAGVILNSAVLTNPSLAPLSKAIEGVHALSKDIAILNQSWRYVLKREPNEIWEPSVPAFTKSQFWVTTQKARLSRIAPLKQHSAKKHHHILSHLRLWIGSWCSQIISPQVSAMKPSRIIHSLTLMQ